VQDLYLGHTAITEQTGAAKVAVSRWFYAPISSCVTTSRISGEISVTVTVGDHATLVNRRVGDVMTSAKSPVIASHSES
jgi:hypothetical protein